MDKNIIKQYLAQNFLSEVTKNGEKSSPGIKLAGKMGGENKKINKAGVDAVAKDMKDIEQSSKKMDANSKTMATNKFNYVDKQEEDYHQEMEIMNGQEMNHYDREPNQQFKDRAMEAIEGSTRMGNSSEYANVVAKGQGGDPEFGKNLVKRIKASEKKRAEQTPSTKMYGNDWEVISDKGHKSYAFENEDKSKCPACDNKKSDCKCTDKEKAKHAMKGLDMDYEKDSRSQQYGINPETMDETKNTTKSKIEMKETIKRLKFKKEFNGVSNVIKLIPESYKVDNKIFEMTDGNESYKIRWEGSVKYGKPVILMASDKTLVNEDIQKMKHLFGYKPHETLGVVKGNQRLNENKEFFSVWDKTKSLLKENEEESIVNEAFTQAEIEGLLAGVFGLGLGLSILAPAAIAKIKQIIAKKDGRTPEEVSDEELESIGQQAAKGFSSAKSRIGEEEEGEDDAPIRKRKDAYDASLDVADPEDMEKSMSKSDIEKSVKEPAIINKDVDVDDEDDIEIPKADNTELKLAKSTSTGQYAILTKIDGKIVSDTKIPVELAMDIKDGKVNIKAALDSIKADQETEMSDDELMEALDKMINK